MMSPSSRVDVVGAVGQDPQEQRHAAFERLERVEAHAVLRAHPADEALDRAVREDEPHGAGLYARGPLHAHDGRDDERRPLRREPLRPPVELVPDHCGGSGLPCIAAQTRAGVQGMSTCVTPCDSCSASITALTMAGGDPTFGDSPTPFAPSGWCGQGVTVSPSSKSGHSSAVGIR